MFNKAKQFVTRTIPYAVAFAAGITVTAITEAGAKVASKIRTLIKGTAA